MKERYFKFKRFSVSHKKSAMPVGVDGVLVGAWADAAGARNILDIGTGCGVIALMMAQRFPGAQIMAIDIDEPSIEEADENFRASIWSERLTARNISLQDYVPEQQGGIFDFIITNPPFFVSGVSNPDSSRLKARHDASLPLSELAMQSARLLRDGGELALILPVGEPEHIFSEYALSAGLKESRKVYVRGHRNKPIKRVLMQWCKGAESGEAHQEKQYKTDAELILEDAPGHPSDAYRELCSDFYLKF